MDKISLIFKKFMDSGEAEKIGYEIKKLVGVGEWIIGRLVGVEYFKSKKYAKTLSMLLHFETDEGRESMICGSTFVDKYKDALVVGDIYKIEYDGDVETNSGHKCKKWKLWHVRDNEGESVSNRGQYKKSVTEIMDEIVTDADTRHSKPDKGKNNGFVLPNLFTKKVKKE